MKFIEAVKKFSGWAGLLSLILFGTDLLDWATPLPFVYLYLKEGQKSFFSAALFTTLVLGLLVSLGLEPLVEFVKSHPEWSQTLSINALQLRNDFSLFKVVLILIGQFWFFLGVAYFVSLVLLEPNTLYPKSMRSILILYGTVMVLAVIVIAPDAKLFLQKYHQNVLEFSRALMQEFERSKNVDSYTQAYVSHFLKNLGTYLLYIMPTLLFSSVSFIFIFNLVLAKKLYFIYKPHLLFIHFTDFRLPFEIVWVWIVCVLALVLNSQLFHASAIYFTGINLFLALSLAYFYQGLSVMVCLFDKMNVRGFWRLSLYLVAFYFSVVSFFIFTLVGFFDPWLDLRNRLFRQA